MSINYNLYKYGINKYCMIGPFVPFLLCTCCDRLLNSLVINALTCSMRTLVQCAHLFNAHTRSMRSLVQCAHSFNALTRSLAIFYNSCIKIVRTRQPYAVISISSSNLTKCLKYNILHGNTEN